jgi:hypothetical protein
MSEAEYHQMQVERQEMLEQALRRAINYSATEDDWAVIRYECGLPVQKSIGEYYESNCEI